MSQIAITANGKGYDLPSDSTIADFIERRGLRIESCIAELNGEPLTRDEMRATRLREGDRLEIVRAVAGGADDSRAARLAEARLYLVAPASISPDQLDLALDGGVEIVQLRDHEATDRGLLEAARMFRKAADRHGALFIVNDRPDIAIVSNADGVHVGQDDLPPVDVRAVVGDDLIVGLSTHAEAEVDLAEKSGADYIAVGPVFETPTKAGRPAVGIALVKYAAAHSGLPFFAIGGIDQSNILEVASAGATRVAVVRAIADADDPHRAARELRAAISGR